MVILKSLSASFSSSIKQHKIINLNEFIFSWIQNGIQEHRDELLKIKENKDLLPDVLPVDHEMDQPTDSLKKLLEKLHHIGYNEDEIENILGEVDISKMATHVQSLKDRVESYLKSHRHDTILDKPKLQENARHGNIQVNYKVTKVTCHM